MAFCIGLADAKKEHCIRRSRDLNTDVCFHGKRLSNSPCVSQEESLRVRSIFLPMRAQCRAFAPSLLTTDLLAMSVIYLPLKRGTVTGSRCSRVRRVLLSSVPELRMHSSKWISHNGVAPAVVSLDCWPTSPCCQNHPLTG